MNINFKLDVCDIAPLRDEYLLFCKLISLLMCFQRVRQSTAMACSPTQAVVIGIFFHQYIIILATRVWPIVILADGCRKSLLAS